MDAKELMELLARRRSIRKFTDEPVPPELVRQVAEAGLMSPSSKNDKEVVLVTVTDPETIRAMAGVKKAGGAFVKGAGALVVALGDSRKDIWMVDAGIAMTNMMAMAEALGLGSCWVQILNRFDGEGKPAEENVREILGAPEHLGVLALLALGWPAESQPPRTKEEMAVDREGAPRLFEEKF